MVYRTSTITLLVLLLWCTASVHGVKIRDRVVWEPRLPGDFPAAAGIATTERSSVQEKVARTIAFVKKTMKSYAAPGIALSVVYANETVLAQGFGVTEYGNPNAPVTPHSLFQVGSLSKTFIAVAIAHLVDNGRLNWLDPVQRHLTWFQLADSYATEFTTLADLAAMNSVLGGHEGDDVIGVGVYATEKDLVRALRHLNTTRQIRPGYAYSNLNFEILGQVVEGVTGQPWHEYLKTTIWEPLGMHDTVGRALDSRDPNALSGGHFFCNGTVLGPYSLLNSTMVMIRPGDHYIAAGSILSSPSDLAKFSAFLLRKGAGVFRSSAAISDLITGHNVVPMPPEVATFSGYEFHPDGNAVTAGYGFDTVGDMMYGQHYMDKGGDTFAFHTRNGWLPSLGLGVILVANAQSFSGRLSDMATLDLMRTYIVGVFLDISTETLDRQFHESLAEVDALFPPSPCDAHYYGGIPWDIPGVDIPHATKEALVGAYRAVNSPEYYGPLVVTLHGADLWMQYGVYKRRLVATRDPTMLTWTLEMGDFTATVQVALGTRPRIMYSSIEFVHN